MPLNTITVDTERCKGCYLCIEACSRHLIEVSDRPNAAGYYPARANVDGQCTACAICATVCPDCAIEVFREDKKAK
jgi:2-oxoglutarate ferredoxin oxidoreductase subunit delta